jgi:hypothetical protein
MMDETYFIEFSLKKFFPSGYNIFVDTETKECEVYVSVDDYQGELETLVGDNGVKFNMVDLCDDYPFKYIFQYQLAK